jgi:lactaldehyde dehydrogenase / glycolaldehyde dehydrogenase
MNKAIPKHKNFINGEFLDSDFGEMIQVQNPATEKTISEVPESTEKDVQNAVESAYKAQKAWAKIPPIERAKYLRPLAIALRENEENLARTISEEQGKTLSLARVEVNFAADYIDYMAEWARRIEGEIIPSDKPNENIFLFRAPIGVVGGILPWNFPFFLIIRKMAPALVTGNTIVVKPSCETPNNAFEFAKIVDKSDLPKGVFNVVFGRGSTVGQALAAHPKVGIISMTGSVEAGPKVMEAAAKNITKVSLELGGKAPAIVLADADLDLAVEAIKNSRVGNTGQVCNCAERIYVHKKIADAFTEKMVESMKKVTYGDPLMDKDIDMGPLINKDQFNKVEGLVNRAVKGGAELLIGGEGDSIRGTGCYYKPTVLTNIKQSDEIIRKEVFGPVIPIVTFNDLDEAIEYANDCDYGLTSSIYTSNIDVAMRACNEIRFGETYINRENFEAIQGFHAGWRKSGIGGADGKHGLYEYTQTHVVYLQYNQNVK